MKSEEFAAAMFNSQFSILNSQLKDFQVVIVAGFHLFPFRTEKLSPPAPMVLHTRGRVGSRRFFSRKPLHRKMRGLFVLYRITLNTRITQIILITLRWVNVGALPFCFC